MDDTLTTRLVPDTYIDKDWDKSNTLTWEENESQKVLSWYIHPQGVSADYPYEVCCSRVFDYPNSDTATKSWEAYCANNIGLWAIYAEGAKYYSLTLDNPTDSVFYETKLVSGQTSRELVINECTTSNIRLTLGTLKQTDVAITNLWVVSENSEGTDQEYQFVGDASLIAGSQTITCVKENWEIKLQATKNDDGFYSLSIVSGKILADSDGNFNSVLHLKIIANNVASGVTKTITWTVSAIWDRAITHHYRVYAFPNKYSAYKTVSTVVNGNNYEQESSGQFTYSTDQLTFSVYQDDDNNGWHQILSDFKYYLVMYDYQGNQKQIINSSPSSELNQTLGSEALQSIFNSTFGNSSGITKGSDSKSFLVKLYVNDPDCSKVEDTYNGNYYLADQTIVTFEYIVTEIKQGATGATGGTVAISSTLDTSSSKLTLTIGSDTYVISNVTKK